MGVDIAEHHCKKPQTGTTFFHNIILITINQSLANPPFLQVVSIQEELSLSFLDTKFVGFLYKTAEYQTNDVKHFIKSFAG